MNILYRQIEDLCINEHVFEKRLEFYQENYYDNVYFLSEDGSLNTFYNYQIEIEGKSCDIEPVQIDVSTEDIYDWFQKHPGSCRVPVVKNGILCGEYYDASRTGQILYKSIEDRAIQLFPVFKKDILSKYKNKRIGVLNNSVNEVLSLFPTVRICQKCYEDFDVIIDTNFISSFRRLLGYDDKKIFSPSEILLPILIEKTVKYFQSINVNFLFINGMMKKTMTDVTDEEKVRLETSLEQLLKDESIIQRFCEDDPLSFRKLNEHKYDLNQCAKVVFNGIHNTLLDRLEEDYSIIDGKRYTSGVPSDPISSIHVYGPCVVMGYCVADESTICSLLQDQTNKFGYNIEIVNHGLAYGDDKLNDILCMMATPIKEQDSIVWFSGFDDQGLEYLQDLGVPIIDAKTQVQHLTNWFLDNPFHCNVKANKKFADAVFKWWKDKYKEMPKRERQSLISALKVDLHYNAEAILDSHELVVYRDYLKKYKCDESIKRRGAVVLNANPFTKGHMYLIEKALHYVDFLYVFLVEETKDSFSFLDREYMAKESLKYNRRIAVLSGGNVMTSEKIFPEYFKKDLKPSKTSLVLTHKVFACIVGPALGISFRFFGTEPVDKVTRALNESAKKILPQYGIQPVFINRFEIDGKHFSASSARTFLQNKQYEELARFVPFPTYKRLLEIYNEFNDKTAELYFQHCNYTSSCFPNEMEPLELLESDIECNTIQYPGKVKKFGCTFNGSSYMVKLARNNSERLGLYSEKIGSILCQQLGVETSEINIAHYNGELVLLSKSWKTDTNSQFFPLSAYFEELIDYENFHDIRFKYDIFKHIIRKKCGNRYDKLMTTFWKVSVIDYLLCNARSAGNTGFLDDGNIKLSPNYDNSTWLESIGDTRFLSKEFPRLLMEFAVEYNSAFYVFITLDDPYMKSALEYARTHIDLSALYDTISSPEERYLFDVIQCRYSMLWK